VLDSELFMRREASSIFNLSSILRAFWFCLACGAILPTTQICLAAILNLTQSTNNPIFTRQEWVFPIPSSSSQVKVSKGMETHAIS
jgi:hypothetical protein